MPRPRLNAARFWAQVRQHVGPRGCWEWAGPRQPDNRPRGGRYNSRPAHRVAWELVKGPLPGTVEPRPTCGNAECIHPDHQVCCPRGAGARQAHLGNRYAARLDAATVATIQAQATRPATVATVAAELGVPLQQARRVLRGPVGKLAPATQDAIRAAAAAGTSVRKLAAAYGVAADTIQAVLHAPPARSRGPHKNRWTADQDAQLRAYYTLIPIAQLARLLGRTYQAVTTRASQQGLHRRRGRPRAA